MLQKPAISALITPTRYPLGLALSVTPVLIGTCLAWAETGKFNWSATLIPLTAFLLLQIAIGMITRRANTQFTLALIAGSEFFAFICFGLVAVMSSYYLQTLNLSLNTLFAACALGLQASAIWLVANYRDQACGQRENRFSIVSQHGSQRSQASYSALLLLSFPVLLPVLFFRPVAGIALVTLSPTIRMIRFFCEAQTGAELSRVLAGTVTLQLIFGVALSIGLLFG